MNVEERTISCLTELTNEPVPESFSEEYRIFNQLISSLTNEEIIAVRESVEERENGIIIERIFEIRKNEKTYTGYLGINNKVLAQFDLTDEYKNIKEYMKIFGLYEEDFPSLVKSVINEGDLK